METIDTPAVRYPSSVGSDKITTGSASSIDEDHGNIDHLTTSFETPRDAYLRSLAINSTDRNDLNGVGRSGGIADHFEATGLKRGLDERHVNMIAFSTIVGMGLFLQAGRVIYLAGPGGAVMAYLLMGSIVWSVIACLGEMSALFPVPGAIFQMPCRFVDASIGYAVGWMSWFSWVVIIASEVDAVATMFDFQFNSSSYSFQAISNCTATATPDHQWSGTGNVNPAVWVTISLIVIFAINILPVRVYGEIEYWIGVLKMFFLVGLIMFNVIVNAQSGTGFKFYQSPWGFFSKNFQTKSHSYSCALGHLASIWTAMTVTIFSMIGFETISITAAENKDFEEREGIKLSARKISLRIVLLYTLAAFVVGLNVPYNDCYLSDVAIASLGGGQHSVFIAAAVLNNKSGWADFMNGFFILSATSAGINSLYISSRILHGLAIEKRAWPRWRWAVSVRSWLASTTKRGVPRHAVLASILFGLLGYLAAHRAPSVVYESSTDKPSFTSQALGRLATNSTVSMLITYSAICLAFINYKKSIKKFSAEDTNRAPWFDRGQDRNAYDRNAETYPYRSHFQPGRTWYALLGCVTMAVFNGWRSLSPFSVWDFIASYISVLVFIFISIAYHVKLQGWNLLCWRLDPSKDFSNPTMIPPEFRNPPRDKLRLPDKSKLTTENSRELARWLWVWLK